MLKTAFNRAGGLRNKLLDFARKNSWVNDYALYMAIKKSYNGLPWQKWEQKHKDYNLAVLNADEFKNDVNFYILF